MLKIACSTLLGTLVASTSALANERVTVGSFVGAHVFSPTIELGVVDRPASDSPSNTIAFGVRAGYQFLRSIAVESELAIMPGQTRASREDVTVFGWRVQAIVDVLPEDRLRPFALVGMGLLTVSPSNPSVIDEDTDLVGHIGLGLEFDLDPQWALRGDVRLLFAPTTASDGLTRDTEVFLGFARRFGAYDAPDPIDSDGDGVFAPQDRCPDAVEDQDGFDDEDGCPDPDNDGDGVADADDRCPAEAESPNGIDDTDGCPEADGDGDGITGSRDQCPQQAEDFDGLEDEDGCPEVDPVPVEPEPPAEDATPETETSS